MELFSPLQLLTITLLLMLWVLSVIYIETRRHIWASVQIVCVALLWWLWYMLMPTLLEYAWVIDQIQDDEMTDALGIDRLYIYNTDVHNAAVAPWLHWPKVIFTSKTYEEMPRGHLFWVVAHEVWHVAMHHLWKQLFLLGMLWYVIVRLFQYLIWVGIYRYICLLFLIIIRGLTYMAVARMFERQADNYAANIWHASELADYFETMLQESETGHKNRHRSRLSRFLYLHDSPQERIGVLRGVSQ